MAQWFRKIPERVSFTMVYHNYYNKISRKWFKYKDCLAIIFSQLWQCFSRGEISKYILKNLSTYGVSSIYIKYMYQTTLIVTKIHTTNICQLLELFQTPHLSFCTCTLWRGSQFTVKVQDNVVSNDVQVPGVLMASQAV